MKIKLIQDSRDEHYHIFGQTVDFPLTATYDDPSIPQKIQPIGNVECTCYAATYVAQNFTKVEYDIDDLFNRIPHSTFGADPRDVLGEVIKNGLLPKGGTERVNPYSSYFRADTGGLDKFNNTRSAQMQTNSPVMIWTNWYHNWLNLGPNGVMPVGDTAVSDHMYTGLGWIDGEDMVIEWWGGYTMRMPRATFNDAVSKRGCGTAVFSTKVLDQIRSKTWTESVSDYFVNMILAIQALINQLKPPMNDYNTPPQPSVAPVQPVVVPPPPKYLWDTAENARHSVRVICDEEGLTAKQKNLMSQVVHCESGYKTTATHPNLNKNGKQVSCDYGIAQWNDFYHGSEISPDEAVHNPEKAIRLMCSYVKTGKISQWVCYSSGLFKQYTP